MISPRGQKTALIAGVTGQDGAYLAHYLLGLGYRVVGSSRDAQMADTSRLERLGVKGDVELVSLYDDEADLGYYDDLTFDPAYLQEGMAKSLQELRDKGVQVPSTKAFMTKPDILGSRRREADVDGLPENVL